MSIRNVVFDVGNVLFAYDPVALLDRLLPGSPHRSFYLENLLNAPIWDALDRGDLSAEEAVEQLATGQSDVTRQIEEMLYFIKNFSTHLPLILESKALFLRLLDTHSVYILSNFQAVPFQRMLSLHPFLDQAKGRIISEEVRLAKPEKAIYELLLQRFNLTPSQTVFIDDKEANIQACESVGMTGIVFDHYARVEKTLKGLGCV